MSASPTSAVAESAAPATEPTLEDVLGALSDPVRMRIVRTLAAEEGGRACGTFDLPVTKSTASHHFKVLREAGVIRQEERGRTKHTTLRRDELEARFPGLLALVLRER
jgi:DNA-binding transcriptional ArsR family regulator